MSILQSSNVGGLKDATKGMVGNELAMHPLKKCNKKELLCSALAANLWDGVGINCNS